MCTALYSIPNCSLLYYHSNNKLVFLNQFNLVPARQIVTTGGIQPLLDITTCGGL